MVSEKSPRLKSTDNSTLDASINKHSVPTSPGTLHDPYIDVDMCHTKLLKGQTDKPEAKATVLTLFKYSTGKDLALLLWGVFFAIVAGAAQPTFTFVIGGITNNFRDFNIGAITGAEFRHVVDHNCLYFVYIGVGVAVSSFVSAFLLNNGGETIAARYRKNYLKAAIRQNIGYYDNLGAGHVATSFTSDTASVQAAISNTMAQIIKGIATFVSGTVIALVIEWKLALIGLSCTAWFVVMVMGNGAMFGKFTGVSMYAYREGSNVAEEALSAARSTISLSAQSKMVRKFDLSLIRCQKLMHRASLHLSIMMCVMWSILGFLYALITWEGSRLVKNDETSVGSIITVLVAMLMAMFNLGGLGPQIRKLTTGIAAAKTLNETLCRQPIIDIETSGIILEQLEGHIVFHDVHFRYPSRPDNLVLPNFSLEVKPGQTVALIGESGSGKSTIIGLLERFYLPLEGSITIDGVTIEKFDLKWLRQQIGLVSQEPTLFAGTIAENIAFGLVGTHYMQSSAEQRWELVEDACRLANAWEFIDALPEGLDTYIGPQSMLSGGQKQRVAIARAIVSNPKILLLDEATSALDTKSEGVVQQALDRAAASRTTIIIAHRLSTVKNADNIVVLKEGEIIEQGTHQHLVGRGGEYARLVELQGFQNEETSVASPDTSHDSDRDHSMPTELVVKTSDQSAINSSTPSTLSIVKLLFRYNKDQKYRLGFALIFSVAVGYAQIAYAMLLGRTTQSMMVLPREYPHMRSVVNVTSGFFFMVGMHQVIIGFLVLYALNTSADHLLRNIRLALFKQMMRMDISFFDTWSPGALVAILARDGKGIEGFGGSTIAQILQCTVIIIGGAVTGIAFNWRLGLVGTACYPILLGSGFVRIKILGMLEQRNNAVFEISGKLATTFINSIRTIQSLTRESQVTREYDQLIDKQVKAALIPTIAAAVVYGISEGMLYWVWGLIWFYGGKLLSEHKIHVFAYYVVFLGIVIGGNSAVMFFSFFPDLGAAKKSAINVFKMLESVPLIDNESSDGVCVSSVKGKLQFRNVHFRYPARPQVPVLCGLDITVEPGQSVAFVGSSGCGKSTAINLAERFYDPCVGSVLLDGIDYKDYNIRNLRSHISLVQQEPTLYSGTIRENLLVGLNESDSVSQETLASCCREANIHEFIMSLPEGYETNIGGKGVLLSGGQKQRIAIARALVTNPSILLLDEATSALDAESERAVQEALDDASMGRTTVCVAHRLSSIQKCDVIYVLDKGAVVEKGTHHELVAMNGAYAELARTQQV